MGMLRIVFNITCYIQLKNSEADYRFIIGQDFFSIPFRNFESLKI